MLVGNKLLDINIIANKSMLGKYSKIKNEVNDLYTCSSELWR